jgi:hypothetical protein
MNAHTRHLRGTLPLTGYRPSWATYAGFAVVGFLFAMVAL